MRYCKECGELFDLGDIAECMSCHVPTEAAEVPEGAQGTLFDVPVEKVRSHLSYLRSIYQDAVAASNKAARAAEEKARLAEVHGRELVNYLNQINAPRAAPGPGRRGPRGPRAIELLPASADVLDAERETVEV